MTLQTPGEGEVGGRVTRRKMVDKGQVTDDISVTVSAQSDTDITGTTGMLPSTKRLVPFVLTPATPPD